MAPDEVRKMDNKKCLIFIRGFDPILDNKYNPFKHSVFAQTADGEGKPYVHEPAAEGESAEPGFTILNKKSLAYYEGMKEKGEPVYIDTIPYEDFMLLGQVDMEKRFMDLDGLEQQERLNEDMESGLELEYAFDTEDGADGGFAAGGAETSGNRTAGNSGQQTGQECRKRLCREETGNQRQWQIAGKYHPQTGGVKQRIPFPTVCSTGNSAWSRKRKSSGQWLSVCQRKSYCPIFIRKLRWYG